MVHQEPTRRAFLRGAVALGSTLAPLAHPGSIGVDIMRESDADSTGGGILRQPDALIAYAGLEAPCPLKPHGDAWSSKGILVEFDLDPSSNEQLIRLTSQATALSHLHLRWNVRNQGEIRCLGDAWERSYGDLEWRGIVPDRVMPWYCLTFDGRVLRGYGVKTQPAAFCFWQLDREGISLWADIRNGGLPLRLGQRQLEVATIVSRTGKPGETTFEAARGFCKMMCAAPRLPSAPLCGSNDWYYAYGKKHSRWHTARRRSPEPHCSSNRTAPLCCDRRWLAESRAFSQHVRSRRSHPRTQSSPWVMDSPSKGPVRRESIAAATGRPIWTQRPTKQSRVGSDNSRGNGANSR